MTLKEILVGSCWWMQLCRICMQFPILIFCQNYEGTLNERSHSNYSFIVIIFCFYSYKLIIRSTFCMNLMWQWSSFHFVFFDLKLTFFLLSRWLRQCWSIWHVNILYCSFLFKKIDWSLIKQSAASQTWFLTNKCVLRQSICPWQCQ